MDEHQTMCDANVTFSACDLKDLPSAQVSHKVTQNLTYHFDYYNWAK